MLLVSLPSARNLSVYVTSELFTVPQLNRKPHVLISLLSALPSPVNGFDDRSHISQNLLRVAPPNECVYRYRLKSFKNYLNSLLVKYIHFSIYVQYIQLSKNYRNINFNFVTRLTVNIQWTKLHGISYC